LKKYWVMAELAPAFTLVAKACRSAIGRLGLRVGFGVGGHFNVEMVAGFRAHESHQIAGIVKLAAHAVATGQVTAQRHQALHAHGLERGELFAHAGFGGTNARKMRSRRHAFGLMARTVSNVPCCVEPPAPKVTEQNSGFTA
jgi:hypothetical protein